MTLPKMVARMAIDNVKRLKEARRAYYRGELDNYCPHGTYVGGCGIDWMCHYCESGYSDYEVALGAAWDESARIRKSHADELFRTIFRGHSDVFDYMTSRELSQFVTAFTYLDATMKGRQ
jgi:hypothetical protein